MKRASWRGECLVSYLAPGDLCFIEVVNDPRIDSLDPESPEDFAGSFKGMITAVDERQISDVPYGVRAVFDDPRIRQDQRSYISWYHGHEPPFPYRVSPRYRMQGITLEPGMKTDDPCFILVGDFHDENDLCQNPSLSPAEIRDLCSKQFVGKWFGRVVQSVSNGYQISGATYYPVAATLADPAIQDDPLLADWVARELPMKYLVVPSIFSIAGPVYLERLVRAGTRFTHQGLRALEREWQALTKAFNL